MVKNVLPGERVTTVTLDGSECAVKFSRPFKAFSVRNDGDTDVYIALESGKSAGDDGVICVPSGGSDTYFHGRQLDTCYLLGAAGGKVQLKAQDTDCNSFRNRGKGSGGEENTIDTSLKLYFDYRKGITGNTWTDTVSNSSIDILTVPSETNDFVTAKWYTALPNLNKMYAFTAYLICKYTGSDSEKWVSVLIANEGSAPHFNCEITSGYFGIGATSGSGGYSTKVKATDNKYHIIAMSFFNGTGLLYIDGVKQGISKAYYSPINSYFHIGALNYKAIKIYEGVAHENDVIVENTRLLASEFNIEI